MLAKEWKFNQESVNKETIHRVGLRELKQDDEAPRDMKMWGNLNVHTEGIVFESPASTAVTAEAPAWQELQKTGSRKGVVGVKCQAEVALGAGNTLSLQRPPSMVRYNLGATFRG